LKLPRAWIVACSRGDTKDLEDLGVFALSLMGQEATAATLSDAKKVARSSGLLGGKIARRTREMSGGLMLKAKDLASLGAQASGVCSFSDIDLCDGDSVFEIGSDVDDDDFAFSDMDSPSPTGSESSSSWIGSDLDSPSEDGDAEAETASGDGNGNAEGLDGKSAERSGCPFRQFDALHDELHSGRFTPITDHLCLGA